MTGRSTKTGVPDALAWARHLGPFAALSHEFEVRCTEAVLGDYLAHVLKDLRVSDTRRAPAVYSVADLGPDVPDRYAVWVDGERIAATPYPRGALSAVLWTVNRRSTDHASDRVIVHASAASWDGDVVLLPAPMESGKTTLVAGLVRAGLGYVTDEAVGVDLADGSVTGLAKPLTIDRGSWEVLADLEPDVPEAVVPYLREQWHVPASAIRAGAVVAGGRPRLVVSPRYARGAATELEPMRRADALVELIDNSFNMAVVGRDGFEALARVVRSCECYRLRVGELDEACRLVLGLLGVPAHPIEAEEAS